MWIGWGLLVCPLSIIGNVANLWKSLWNRSVSGSAKAGRKIWNWNKLVQIPTNRNTHSEINGTFIPLWLVSLKIEFWRKSETSSIMTIWNYLSRNVMRYKASCLVRICWHLKIDYWYILRYNTYWNSRIIFQLVIPMIESVATEEHFNKLDSLMRTVFF